MKELYALGYGLAACAIMAKLTLPSPSTSIEETFFGNKGLMAIAYGYFDNFVAVEDDRLLVDFPEEELACFVGVAAKELFEQ